MNEIAAQSGVAIEIAESALPVRNEVRAACELLGFDPLYIANEGKLVAAVPPNAVEAVLAAMRASPQGGDARIIGEVVHGFPGRVTLRTNIGATRVMEMLTGELLPRIC